ncbi:MAG TPA: response regulator transcription factor [Kiritimatiellia bacterium]|nr:response regulator transcription factor [Kiritimatiellia bacterium]HPR69221.1 response regulator transcription factor [Kiritimatiellia bacterium]
MKAAIIDDEEIDRLNLRTLLEDHGDIEIAGEAATLEAAVELMDRETPDAVFLDIHLGRQKGFAALEQAANRPLVVITTSHPHYAAKGFEIDAVDFLLKPVDEAALVRAVGRLRRRLAAGGVKESRLDPGDIQLFKEADGLHLATVGEIQAVVGERIYTRVLVRDGRSFLHNRPLREWRRLLPEKLFKVLDRSVIVNLQEIRVIKETGPEGRPQIVFRGSPHRLEVGESAMKSLRRLRD